MDGAKCPACFGSGVGQYIFHGIERNGEACIEPIRCESCGGFGWADSGESNGSDEVSKATDVYPQRSGHRMVSCNLEISDLLQRQNNEATMNTDDYYAQQIARLEADVRYWKGAYINNASKMLALQAQIDQLKADKARMDEWLDQCQYVEGRCSTPMFAKVDDTGEVTAVYAEQWTDLTAVLGREQVQNIQGQVLDSREG